MDDFWVLHVFKLNTGRIYLVPTWNTDEEEAWKKLASTLSRSVERTKNDAKYILSMNGSYQMGVKKI